MDKNGESFWDASLLRYLPSLMIYLSLLPISILVTLLAYLLAPVLPLFASLQLGWINNAEKQAVEPRLTGWLFALFGTEDNSLLGDDGHKARWAGKSRYWQMAAWICRNSGYNADLYLLGATCSKSDEIYTLGNPWIKNRANAVSGWYFCRVGSYWNFKAVIPLFGDLAFMPEFGWKLQPWAQGRPDGDRAMYVFSPRFTAFYK